MAVFFLYTLKHTQLRVVEMYAICSIQMLLRTIWETSKWPCTKKKQYKQKLRILNMSSQHPCTNQCTLFPVVESQWQNGYIKTFLSYKQIVKHLIRWSNKNWHLFSTSLEKYNNLNRNIFINRIWIIKFTAPLLACTLCCRIQMTLGIRGEQCGAEG